MSRAATSRNSAQQALRVAPRVHTTAAKEDTRA